MAIVEKKYAFFLGCTAPVRTQNYELSTRRVASELGMMLVDLDFNCCGFPLESLDSRKALAISLRNLAVAEEAGFTDIVTICTGCAGQLEKTNYLVKRDPNLLKLLNEEISETGHCYKGNVQVRHFVRVLYQDITSQMIANRTLKKLNRFKVAPFYGCHYIRPTHVTGAMVELEAPFTLDRLIEATGASTLNYFGKDKCCGGFLLGLNQEVAFSMSQQRINAIKEVSPDAIVLVCPFCGIMMQHTIKEVSVCLEEPLNIPVLDYPQLLGLALGISANQLCLDQGVEEFLS